MRNYKLNFNDLARKWPLPIRKGIKIYDESLGILEVTIEGKTEITSEMLEQMKTKFGYICQKINVYPCIPKSLKGHINIQDEDDVSALFVTSITFREYQAPSLENCGKRDEKALKKTKPQQTEIRVGARDSVCGGSTVDTDHHQGDDPNR
jgi:hypothetical protein